MNKNFKNKTVWITGARRIGQVIAERFAQEGANLVISYRSSEKEARDVINKVKKYKVKTLMVQCDVSKKESVEKAVKEIRKKFKRVDVLVNMASIFNPTNLEKVSEKDWIANFNVHVLGTFWPVQSLVKMIPNGGHVINIADRTSIGKAYKGYLPYIVTKAAVSNMTKVLAKELAGKGIFVNAIAPGPIMRPPDLSEKEWQKIRNSSPLKYKITDKEAVEEFAKLTLYLAGVTMASGYTYPLTQGQNL